jgi:hypothetical protein
MRSALLKRLKTLEAKSPDPTESQKPLLPTWLTEELEKQGIRFDASGFPEKIGWNPALNFGGLGGIQRAWLEKS